MNLLRVLQQHRRSMGLLLALLYLLSLVSGWLLWPDTFFRGYWFGLMFWTQLAVGAWIVLLLQHLTGGEWGRTSAPYLSAIASSIYLLIPLFLPPLLALSHIFPWTQITPGISAPVLVNKEPWLNPLAFTVRTLFYLAALGVMINLRRRETLPTKSGPFLVATIILLSLYSADWMMSLEPTFYSSLYPFLYFSGALVSIFSLICGITSWLQIKGLAFANSKLLLDYGTLLFASVLFWGYIVFCQFIIIWTGNLPDEAEWYVIRAEPRWLWLTVLLVATHFAIPFCLLLSREIKRDPRKLLSIAAPLFAVHLLEVFWLMRPSAGNDIEVSPFDFLMPLLIGAGWLWFVLGARETLPSISTTEAAYEH